MKLKITIAIDDTLDIEAKEKARILDIVRDTLSKFGCDIEVGDDTITIGDGINFITRVGSMAKQLSMLKKATASIQNISNYLDIIERYDNITAEYIGDITKDRIAQYIRDAKEGDMFAVVYNNSWITDLMAEDHDTVVYGTRKHIVKLVNDDISYDMIDLNQTSNHVRYFKVVIKDNAKTGVEITVRDLKKNLGR